MNIRLITTSQPQPQPQPEVRSRQRPIDRQAVYGDYADRMLRGERFFQDVTHRAAFVYITGCFPSHLRRTYSGALRQITHLRKRFSSLDGRSGNLSVEDAAVRDLQIERHPMVIAVRAKIAEGYFIQPSRGRGMRRSFSKIYMFRMVPESATYMKITVNLEGAIKPGWERAARNQH